MQILTVFSMLLYFHYFIYILIFFNYKSSFMFLWNVKRTRTLDTVQVYLGLHVVLLNTGLAIQSPPAFINVQ